MFVHERSAKKQIFFDQFTEGRKCRLERNLAETWFNYPEVDHRPCGLPSFKTNSSDAWFSVPNGNVLNRRSIRINWPLNLSLKPSKIAEAVKLEREQIRVSYLRQKPKKEHPGRMALPSHLPVVEILIEPLEDTTIWFELVRKLPKNWIIHG